MADAPTECSIADVVTTLRELSREAAPQHPREQDEVAAQAFREVGNPKLIALRACLIACPETKHVHGGFPTVDDVPVDHRNSACNTAVWLWQRCSLQGVSAEQAVDEVVALRNGPEYDALGIAYIGGLAPIRPIAIGPRMEWMPFEMVGSKIEVLADLALIWKETPYIRACEPASVLIRKVRARYSINENPHEPTGARTAPRNTYATMFEPYVALTGLLPFGPAHPIFCRVARPLNVSVEMGFNEPFPRKLGEPHPLDEIRIDEFQKICSYWDRMDGMARSKMLVPLVRLHRAKLSIGSNRVDAAIDMRIALETTFGADNVRSDFGRVVGTNAARYVPLDTTDTTASEAIGANVARIHGRLSGCVHRGIADDTSAFLDDFIECYLYTMAALRRAIFEGGLPRNWDAIPHFVAPKNS